MREATFNQSFIPALHPIEEAFLFYPSIRRVLFKPLPYKGALQIGYHTNRHCQRNEQHDCNRPREGLQKFVIHTGCCDQKGKERDADSQRGGKDGFKKLARTSDGSMPPGISLPQLLDVTVDYDNGVIDNHAQGNE